jgi:hypothetical protein
MLLVPAPARCSKFGAAGMGSALGERSGPGSLRCSRWPCFGFLAQSDGRRMRRRRAMNVEVARQNA